MAKGLYLRPAQLSRIALGQVAKAQGTDADPAQVHHPVAEGLQRAADLALPALVQDHPQPRCAGVGASSNKLHSHGSSAAGFLVHGRAIQNAG